ncbi:alpha/beta fold hydrolase [Frondihabitans sp. PhB188]|uniref:alpha/beta fold hydrolase n=1 Tax=Frondihabitans sp. PhB188 TaxID=2485200 RepID=UPI000F472A76|nr:alpha/beta fold hydrolase [Frondihabitans sp. PhB188]
MTTPTVTKHYVDLEHGQLHVRLAGPDDGPALLLIHQVPSSSQMWEAVIPRFADRGHRVIAVDLPGYGMSDPMPTAPELEDYAAVLFAALDQLGVVRVAIVGHHTGSSVGVAMSVADPSRVTAVAVWGYAMVDPEHAAVLASEQPPVFDDTYVDDVADWWHRRKRWATPGNDGWVMARSLMEYVVAGHHRPDGHNAVGRADHRALLDAVTVPVLFLTGDREMLDADTRSAFEVAPPSVELYGFGDEGIDIADDIPERFAAVVHEFVAKAAAPVA